MEEVKERTSVDIEGIRFPVTGEGKYQTGTSNKWGDYRDGGNRVTGKCWK